MINSENVRRVDERTCMHAHTHAHTHIYTHSHIHTHTHTHTHTHAHTHTHKYTNHTGIHVCRYALASICGRIVCTTDVFRVWDRPKKTHGILLEHIKLMIIGRGNGETAYTY